MSVLLVASIVLAACHAAVGKVRDGVYMAHDEVFSLPVPKLSVGIALQEGLDRDPFDTVTGGYVDFHDDFGNLRSVVYQRLDVKQQSSLADPLRAKKFAAQQLQDRYLRKLKVRFPGVRVVHDEPVYLPDRAWGWIAMVEIPASASRASEAPAKSASLATTPSSSVASAHDASSSRDSARAADGTPTRDGSTAPSQSPTSASGRENVTRGFLLVVRRNLFLTLSAVNDPSGTLEQDAPATDAEAAQREHTKRALLDLYASMKFR